MVPYNANTVNIKFTLASYGSSSPPTQNVFELDTNNKVTVIRMLPTMLGQIVGLGKFVVIVNVKVISVMVMLGLIIIRPHATRS